MKIERTGPAPVTPAQRPDAGTTAAAAHPESAPPAPTDTVTVSGKAREAARLRSRLQQAPDVRLDLVERIKAQVDAGTYHVSPAAVAAKLLRSGVLDE
jgi:flagellar biosynthesis anti-sigma factor FlgM